MTSQKSLLLIFFGVLFFLLFAKYVIGDSVFDEQFKTPAGMIESNYGKER